ncbi:MAG: hypothetical protein HZA88_24975 [Verrucomicrobia bacterium]|nr:hypothetical protein [Verrucomicrobiota bacterium]
MNEIGPPARPSPLSSWETLHQRTIHHAAPWINRSIHRIRLPDGRVIDDFCCIYPTDDMVVAVQTPDDHFIMERQHKHGVGKIILTLPAGGIAAGEESLRAA